MSIIPISIVFENFLAFKEKQKFVFSHSGIHYIYGVDYTINPQDGFRYEDYSVGVGKTSLAMAMQFALYGKIQKKINKDSIINKYTKKNLFIQFDFVVDNEEYRIERYRKHTIHSNNVYLYKKINGTYTNISYNDIRQTQNEIQRLIGLDIRTFEKSILFTRDEKIQFLELPILDRGVIFENLAQINKLREYFDVVHQKLKNVNIELENNNIDILKLSTIIEKDKKYIQQLQEDYNKQKDSLIHTINTIKEKMSIITSLSIDDIKKLLSDYTSLQTQLTTTQQLVTTYTSSIHNQKKILNDKTITINNYEKKIAALKKKIKSLKPITCYQCGAIQNESEYNTTKNTLQEELKTYIQELQDSKEQYILAENELNSLQDTYNQYQSQIKLLQKQIQNIKKQIPNVIITNPNVVNELEKLNTDLQLYTLQLQSLSIDDKIQNLESEIALNTNTLQVLQTKKSNLVLKKRMLEFWESILDFKTENSIKQYIISKIIPIFNYLLQQIVDAVYCGDMVITFDNFFNETIIYKNNVTLYDELSTGEKAKLNFCIYLAIFDLIRINLNGINVIFLDEIFNNVDLPTIKIFITIIKERYAKDNGVYIISHQSEVRDNLYPQSVIRIEKTEETSKILFET